MSAESDPYKHHPHLRGKIVDPLTSRYRDIDVSAIDARMREIGMPIHWRRTDEERERIRLDTLQGRENGDLWLFGYGSLIWDPGFRFDEVRIGKLTGYHRRFCIRSELGRGSPENPGMMVGLDKGGHCESVLFRIPRSIIHDETQRIWRREMLRQTYHARFFPVETGQGTVEALTFVIDQGCETYLCDVDLAQAASFIAYGKGFYGTSLEYLENLAKQLDAFGIRDDSVQTLLRMARELADGPR